MARAKSHKDVEFHVTTRPSSGGKGVVAKTFADAADVAVSHAMTGHTAVIDVVVWSRAGAKWLLGDAGVREYDEDPDASVFERIEVNVRSLGRIP